jgi:hypothetical protein
VILLPGLKGDSMSGAAPHWLAEAGAADAEAQDDVTGRDTGSRYKSRAPKLGNGDRDLGVQADTEHNDTLTGFRVGRPVTRRQGLGDSVAVGPAHTAHGQKDVQWSEDLDGVRPDQSRSLSRDVRDCSTTAAVAVEVSHSSKDWSYAVHDTACTVMGGRRGSSAAVPADNIEIKAAPPAAAVGSGLYMFSVGQSVAA